MISYNHSGRVLLFVSMIAAAKSNHQLEAY